MSRPSPSKFVPHDYQSAGVWSGWEGLGDREIVREASAKGTHLELAYKFLEQRRRCTVSEAKEYFAREVDIWVSGLVKKKQIHRASHILKNVGKVPADYIKTVCLECKEHELRDYLAQHVEANFSSEEKQAWQLLGYIAKHEANLEHPNEHPISHKSIAEIMNQPQRIKDALYVELYFNSYEPSIVEHLNCEVVWDFLLTNSKNDLIELWIDIAFGDGVDITEENYENRRNLCALFREWKITNEMVDAVDSSDGMPLVKNLVLNRLCRYGVFTTKERDDDRLLLSRLYGECLTLADLKQISSKPSCNIVDREALFSRLEAVEFIRSYDDDDESREKNAKNKRLYDCLREMCDATNDHEDFLERGIVETVNYLSDEPVKYLKDNPIVLFTLMCLRCTKLNRTLKDVMSDEDGLTIGSLKLPKEDLQLRLPYLRLELDPEPPKCKLTMYQLIDGYEKFNATEFFKWRLENGPMPTFRSEDLVKKYGYKEKFDYLNYLKEGRPSQAAWFFERQQEKVSGSVSLKSKLRASLCAHVFALRQSPNLEIASGCVAFLEILGVSSENLRLHLTLAKIVRSELNVSIENLLESIIFSNAKDLSLAMDHIERSFSRYLVKSVIDDKDQFIPSLRIWELIVRFAKQHGTTLPTSLLKFLASHDYWFEFVLVGHIFGYPVNQMTDCTKHFKIDSLREHLSLALNNPRLPNSRSEYYKFMEDQKKGRRNRRKIDNVDATATVSQPSAAKPSIITTNDDDTDLWRIILKCHHSQDPPGALLKVSRTLESPILALLATFYEPSSCVSYCYTWLVVSVLDLTKDYNKCLDSQVWTARDVARLLSDMVARGYVVMIGRGLKIFLPENSLGLFFDFLEQCLEYGNFRDCQRLIDFADTFSNYKCNKLINWDCSDATYLENACWLQTIAIVCIISALENASSIRIQTELLGALINCDFRRKLDIEALDFESLLEYTNILTGTGVKLNYQRFDATQKSDESQAEMERCVDELIAAEDYSSALKLAEAAKLKTSRVILAQYRSEFKRNADKDGMVDLSFWRSCSADFQKYEVEHSQAVEFFVEHAEKVKSHVDRYEVLKLALELLEVDSQDKRTRDTVEMAMWRSAILAGPENIAIGRQETLFGKLRTELLSSVSELRVSCALTESNEKAAVEALIQRLLDARRLEMALRIGAIFNCRNRELQVLMLCLSIAEGEISPYELTDQQRALVTDTNRRLKSSVLQSIGGRSRLTSLSSLNSPHHTSEASSTNNAAHVIKQEEQFDRLTLLSDLVETLDHGVDIGMRILFCYRLSLQLGKRYHVLLTFANPIKLLHETVSGPNERKFEIARDIITTYEIDNQSIASFLAEEIIAHITQVIEDNLDEPTNNVNLQSMIELCKDTSLLGMKLLDMAQKLLGHSNGEKRNLVTLKIIVELLIRSHDCFTTSCNMEGIASILRKCQQLANSLRNLKHWSLLVRLVTGVGRFTEMNYVFKILKEHDQFEFLLGRGLIKVPGLRMALIDFLKRNCPDDKDLFNIVALHFRLYHEIALTWENEAKALITDLINEAKRGVVQSSPQMSGVKLLRNETTEKKLQLAITNLTHATQYFLQDNKLNLANRCSHQAQLVALQISLLSSSQQQNIPCVLNLTCDEVNRAICHYLSFTQALILARAYNHHVDWASAIYNRFLLNGDSNYFRDFITSKRLTNSIALDCAHKYRLEKNITAGMAEGMRAIIAELNDVECKYVLASQLGFRTIVEQILDDPVVEAYLKDTVFKRGFVASEFVG